MPRGKLAPSAATGVRHRLAEYVRQHHAGNWASFQRSAGLERTTVAAWKGTKRSTVPDLVQLVQLSARLGLSLDWLLLGHGSMLRDHTSAADSASLRFRTALAQHLGTAEREVAIWVVGHDDAPAHVGQPRAEHFEKVLPDPDDVFLLAAELIRPLLRRYLRVAIDREWRRGSTIEWAGAEGFAPDQPIGNSGRTAREIELEQDQRCERELEEGKLDLIALARYAETLNREGRPPYQVINYDDSGPTSPWGTLNPAQGRSAAP